MDIELLLFALIVLVAHTAETVAGFGSTILAVTLGALLYPIDSLIPVLVPVNLLLSFYIVIRYHKFALKDVLVKRILPFVGLGLPFGFAIFYMGTSDLLKIIFGVFVVIISCWELYLALIKKQEDALPLSFAKSAIVLFLGGLVHGIYASGGPMVVYYSSRTIKDKSAFRSTLNMLWLSINLLLLGAYIVTDKLTEQSLTTSGLMVFPLVIGILIGEWLHHRIEQKTFRIMVLMLLLVSGVSLFL